MTKNTIENKTKSNKQKKRESITHALLEDFLHILLTKILTEKIQKSKNL
jgi:hypothetical protein